MSASYRPDIDGLRCVAVSSVVAFHLFPSVACSGYVGVDCFFVVSGFVVTQSIRERAATGVFPDLVMFYARRIQRLLPALLLCVVACSLAFALLAPPTEETSGNFLTGLLALFGVSNWQLAAQGLDYFGGQATNDPFGHTWSLGIEEQFYLLYAPCLIAALAMSRRRQWTGKIGVIAAGAIAIVSLASFIRTVNVDGMYYVTGRRAWELLAGVLACAFASRPRPLPLAAVPPLSLLGAAAIAFAIVFPGGDTIATTGVVAGTMLVLVTGDSRFKPPTLVARLLARRPLVWIGMLSYGIYLWHWPLIVLTERVVGLTTAISLAVAAATLAVAAASFYILERPIRRMPIPNGRVALRRVAAGIAAAGLAAGIVAIAWKWINPRFSMTRDVAQFVERYRYNRDDLAGVAQPRFELVLIGDSFAYMLLPMLQEAQKTLHFSFRDGSGSGFLFSEDLAIVIPGRDFSDRPKQMREEIDRLVRGGDSPRLLLIACRLAHLEPVHISRSAKPLAGLDWAGRTLVLGSDEASRRYAESLDASCARLEAAGVPVVIMAPIPELRHSPLRGLLTHGAFVDFPSRDEEIEYRRRIMEMLRDIASRHPLVHIWDPFDELCPSETMNPWRGSTLLYWDDFHLSGAGTKMLVPNFVDAVGAAMDQAGSAPASKGRQ